MSRARHPVPRRGGISRLGINLGTGNRKLERAEEDAQDELYFHDLDSNVDDIKAAREIESNRRIVTKAADSEVVFYDEQLEKAKNSQVLQRNLANRIAILQALNDDVITYYRG